LLFKALTDSQH